MLSYKSTRQFLLTYSVLLGITFVAFLVRLTKFDQFSFTSHLIIQIVSIVLVIFLWELLRYINRTLNKIYPYERNISWRIAFQLFLGALVGLFIRILIYYFGEPYLPFKLDELFLAATWVLYIILTIAINLVFFTDYFLTHWRDSLVLAERLEKEKSQVQFDNLKNQLNPHFLFNALTSLNSLIAENQELASQFVHQLSKVYRYVLQNKERSYVTLGTELDFIQHYVSLLQTRFQHALNIEFDITSDMHERNIVPVTIQVLIENAIKHNVIDKERPLTIRIFTSGDYLIVSNNLQPRKNVGTSNKQGLDNMKSLYQFLTEQPVLIEQNDNRFSVKVPLV